MESSTQQQMHEPLRYIYLASSCASSAFCFLSIMLIMFNHRIRSISSPPELVLLILCLLNSSLIFICAYLLNDLTNASNMQNILCAIIGIARVFLNNTQPIYINGLAQWSISKIYGTEYKSSTIHIIANITGIFVGGLCAAYQQYGINACMLCEVSETRSDRTLFLNGFLEISVLLIVVIIGAHNIYIVAFSPKVIRHRHWRKIRQEYVFFIIFWTFEFLTLCFRLITIYTPNFMRTSSNNDAEVVLRLIYGVFLGMFLISIPMMLLTNKTIIYYGRRKLTLSNETMASFANKRIMRESVVRTKHFENYLNYQSIAGEFDETSEVSDDILDEEMEISHYHDLYYTLIAISYIFNIQKDRLCELIDESMRISREHIFRKYHYYNIVNMKLLRNFWLDLSVDKTIHKFEISHFQPILFRDVMEEADITETQIMQAFLPGNNEERIYNTFMEDKVFESKCGKFLIEVLIYEDSNKFRKNRRFLKEYHYHILHSNDTLLFKIYAHITIKINNGDEISFIIIENPKYKISEYAVGNSIYVDGYSKAGVNISNSTLIHSPSASFSTHIKIHPSTRLIFNNRLRDAIGVLQNSNIFGYKLCIQEVMSEITGNIYWIPKEEEKSLADLILRIGVEEEDIINGGENNNINTNDIKDFNESSLNRKSEDFLAEDEEDKENKERGKRKPGYVVFMFNFLNHKVKKHTHDVDDYASNMISNFMELSGKIKDTSGYFV